MLCYVWDNYKHSPAAPACLSPSVTLADSRTPVIPLQQVNDIWNSVAAMH